MKPRILLFENNNILRSALKELLEVLGYEVFSSADAGFCPMFDLYNHNCPSDHACADIIISDVNMSTKIGLELMKERKQRGCKAKYRARSWPGR